MESALVCRINVLPKYIKPRQSNCFKLIKAYLRFLHIFLCFDFGFFNYKSFKQRIFWKSITIIQFTVYCCLMISSSPFHNTVNILSICFLLCHYFGNVISLLLISSDKTLHAVFGALKEIDIALRMDLSFNSEIKMIITISLHLCLRVLIYTFFCVSSEKCFTSYSAHYHNILNMFGHSVVLFYSLVFYSISCRFKKLKSVLRLSNSGFSNLQTMYKLIVDLSEAQKTAFDPLFINSILFNVPVIMACVLYSVEYLISENSVININTLVVLYLIASESFVLILTPAFSAGMLSTQAEKVKTILHDKLLEVHAKSEIQDIERFIHYVKERNCRFHVYKLIPLNPNLLGMLLSFCVTYLIVIIQFIKK